ncbi:lipopolysaccharide/colanic/teichoic acid biosynthesis glycosyltransferase [Sulfitobacter noctilucicola]|uniref:Lipopolysaccharide/colanic/teichoic acid biosynthesis glycosyltransferase n=2 Tax=Sulfitobacter noctilucicola TaxID=1342301 RepID=A0A7W6Q252_9RHOB|nr:lipopolysaccharide/colanic/teichoic acid biosynthesis glycosyltransferase [Sulfitobacter noctilucicola]
MIVLLSPVWIIAAFLIAFEDGGSPLLSQKRVGRHKKVFYCYKLRTMHTETKHVASHDASTSQITKIGKVLRKTGLDELPQLLNIIKGDMNFVGPRPCLPSQSELIAAREAEGVFEIRPGVTGLAQIQGVDMSEPAKLAAIDSKYVRNRTFLMDLKIIRATLGGKGSGDAIKSDS